ncbi:hypothetical protein [Streptomyces sp. NPDC007904]|jgi:hypothetical protein
MARRLLTPPAALPLGPDRSSAHGADPRQWTWPDNAGQQWRLNPA